jgi:4-hydroxymandelate oxidase
MPAGRALFSVADYERAAREVVTRAEFERIYGTLGDGEWSTYTRNRAALDAVALRPRVLRGIGPRSLATSVLGDAVASPVVVGPTDLDHAQTLATARAARALGALFVASAFARCPVAEVAAAAGLWWQQVFVYSDRELTALQVRRAAEHGCAAIVLTVSNVGAPWHHTAARWSPAGPSPAAVQLERVGHPTPRSMRSRPPWIPASVGTTSPGCAHSATGRW